MIEEARRSFQRPHGREQRSFGLVQLPGHRRVGTVAVAVADGHHSCHQLLELGAEARELGEVR